MNEQERKVMELLCQVHNEFVKLEQTHPNDIKDWVSSVHRMQDIISSRITRRDYPKDFATYIKNSDTNEWEKKDMETSDFDKKRVQDVPVNDYKEDKRIRTDFPYGHA